MLYIGVDLGTSAVKLLLMDSTGNIPCISRIRHGRSRILRTGTARASRESAN